MTISTKIIAGSATLLASLTLASTVHVFADSSNSKTDSTPSQEQYFESYEDANTKLSKAYQTRSANDIKDAKSEIDKLDGSDLKTPVELSYNKLIKFVNEIDIAKTAVSNAEKAHKQADVDSAKKVVDTLKEDYQKFDKSNFNTRLTNVSKSIKAEHDKAIADAKAKEDAEAAKLASEKAAEVAKQEAEQKAAEEAEQAKQVEAKQAEATQSTNASQASTSGLDLSQTSGSVDINAVANYMASIQTVAGYSASEWAYIIQHESNGSVTATNASSGAYGVLQLLGHGEYAGMPLSEQIAMAAKLPRGSWVVYN